MKKIGYVLILLLFVGFASHAQLAANRTSETKVADLLAMQPAENVTQLNQAMQEMEGFSKKDFSLLLQGLAPQGGKNAKLKYAANSYSFHLMQPEKANLRPVFIDGLLDALEKMEDKNKKGFIFRLLIQTAGEEVVPAVAPYLQDKDLVGKAARTLNRIGTPKAINALSNALDNVDNANAAIAIISALGDLKAVGTEQKIINQIDRFDHPELNRNIYFALSKMGGPLAKKLFENKLKAIDYHYERDGIAGSAIRYAVRLKENGADKKAIQFVSKLYKKSQKAGGDQVSIAVLKLLNEWKPKKARKKLLKATDSDNKQLRYVGLSGLSSNKAAIKKILKTLPKASVEKQKSVLYFLAEKGTKVDINLILPFAKSPNADVRMAAYQAVSSVREKGNVALFVAQLGKGTKEENQLLEQLILSSRDNNAMAVVNKSLASTTDDKKKERLLEILSERQNDASFDVVFPLTKSTNPSVRKKAFHALSTVSTDANLEKLISKVSRLKGAELKSVRQAIVSALAYSSQKETAINRLAARVAKEPTAVKAHFFPIFSGLGGETALQFIKKYTNSSNANLKSNAIQALAHWKDTKSLPLLLKLFKEKQNDKDFNVLFTGLITKIKNSKNTPEQKGLYFRDAFEKARSVGQQKKALAAMQTTGTYQSFIFAGRFLDDKNLKSVATTTALNIATENAGFYGKDVRRILEKVSYNLTGGGNESSYLNEAVVRHLNEMPEKEGFVAIFNGKDLSGWKGLVGNPISRAKMSATELAKKQKKANEIMRSGWSVENGVLVFNGKGNNIVTTKDYGDFEMLVDWKLDKNGKEPDAGIYLRGTPQVQIWDTSRVNVGAQVGSGGLYNNKKHVSDPLTVADNPLGEWNTFRIRMVGDKVSVWLNGELVTDHTVLENYWDRSLPIFPKGAIELQAHGSKVYYRDIFVKELPKKRKYTLSDEEKKAGFEMLFDGTNLNKWEGSTQYAINKAGELWVNPEADNHNTSRNFFTKKEYSDFVFRFEFKLTPGANNGVGIRAPLKGDAAYEGMEIQILDNTADIYKNLKEYQFHGSVYGVIAAKKGALNPVGSWNKEEIRMDDNKIKVTVNGKVIVDGDIKTASKNGTLDGRKHPGLKRKKGHIGFLGHGDIVYFRNIRVKEL